MKKLKSILILLLVMTITQYAISQLVPPGYFLRNFYIAHSSQSIDVLPIASIFKDSMEMNTSNNPPITLSNKVLYCFSFMDKKGEQVYVYIYIKDFFEQPFGNITNLASDKHSYVPNLSMVRNFVISDSFSAGTYLIDIYNYKNVVNKTIANALVPKMHQAGIEYKRLFETDSGSKAPSIVFRKYRIGDFAGYYQYSENPSVLSSNPGYTLEITGKGLSSQKISNVPIPPHEIVKSSKEQSQIRPLFSFH
jgi:hypothetical protein